VRLVEGVPQLDIRTDVLGSILLGPTFSAAQIIPSLLARSPYGGALLSMHMARVCGHGSHIIEGMLD
jgi:hypothetical protein